MTNVERIRHANLATAIRALAYEATAQEHPHLLLYLQNLTEQLHVARQVAAAVEARCNLLVKRVNALEAAR